MAPTLLSYGYSMLAITFPELISVVCCGTSTWVTNLAVQCSALVALLLGLGAQSASSAVGGDNCSFGNEPWCAGHTSPQVTELPNGDL